MRRLAFPIVQIGWRAHAALAAGAARVLAVLSESTYLAAGDEILWLGRAGALLHPRAVLIDGPLPALTEGEVVALDGAHLRPWRPVTPARPPGTFATARSACRELLPPLADAATPDSLGRLLVGLDPLFPLEAAARHARALGRACAAGDAEGAVAAAGPLVGLGPGLTPSGDDFVGGALFARACLAEAGAGDDAWRAAAAALTRRARERTHPISAALLGDLGCGEGHAPLHDLALGLAAGGSPEATLPPARRLVGLGHSSGWDILSGLVAGLGALPA